MQKKITACLFVCLSLALFATSEARGDCDAKTTEDIELKDDDPINPIKITAPLKLSEGFDFNLDITGKITATIELLGPTPITLTSKKENTSSLEHEEIIYLKQGNYTIKETYSFTLIAPPALAAEGFPDAEIPQKAEFEWKYKAEKDGNYLFSLDGHIRNMNANFQGDDIEGSINIPEPKGKETLVLKTKRDIKQGDEIQFTVTYSADWKRKACIEPIIHKLVSTIEAPDIVSAPSSDFAGQEFPVRMVVENQGTVKETGVTPLLDIIEGSDNVVKVSSPTSEKSDISPGESQTYEWKYRAKSKGEVTFKGKAKSKEGYESNEASKTITIQTPPILTCELKPSEIVMRETKSITLTMTVTNEGETTAIEVTPKLSIPPTLEGKGELIQKFSLTDETQTIQKNESQKYEWLFIAKEGSFGEYKFEGSVSGTDSNSGKPAPTSETCTLSGNIIPPMPIPPLSAQITISSDKIKDQEEITVSAGQALTVNMEVTNNDILGALSVKPKLNISLEGKVTYKSGPKPAQYDIPPGESRIYAWEYKTEDVRAETVVIIRGNASGTNILDETIQSDQAKAQLTIQKTAELSGEIKVQRDVFTKGQKVEVSLDVTNDGEAMAINVTATLEVTPEVGEPQKDFKFEPEGVNISRGETKNFTLKYDTAQIAEGKITLKAIGRGEDKNSGKEVPFKTDPVEMDIQLPPNLTATLEELPEEVRAGDFIIIQLTVRNDGQADATDVAPELLLGGVDNEKFLSSPRPPMVKIIAGNGGSQTYEWTYFTQKEDADKTITFSGKAKGYDANSGEPLESNQTDTQEVSIIPPPKLDCDIEVLPKRVISAGQNIKVRITVKNKGGAQASKVKIEPKIEPQLPIKDEKIPKESDIAGGGEISGELSYTTRPEDTGLYIVSVECSSAEESKDEDSDYVLVQKPAKLEVKKIEAPEEVKVGENITIAVTITNTGEADAIDVTPPHELVVTSLTGTGRAEFVSSPPTTKTILYTRAEITYSWTYEATQEGKIEFRGEINGRDENSDASTSISFATSVEIKPVEGLTARIEATSQISEEQKIYVIMSVTNNSGLPEKSVTPSLEPIGTGTVTLVSDLPEKVSISPGETKEYKWTYSTSKGSAGTITFIGNVKSKSGTTLKKDAESNLVIIQRPPILRCKLEIPSQIHKGDKLIIKLTITNDGEATATGVEPILEVGGIGNSNFLSKSDPPVADISGGRPEVFTFQYDTTRSDIGNINFTGNATGKDGNSDENIPKQNIVTDSDKMVEVITPLVISEFTAFPGQISEGQSITVTMKVKNERKGSITAVRPSLLEIQDSGKAALESGPEPSQTDIIGGETKEFRWIYTTSKGSAGNIQFSGSAGGEGGIVSNEEKTNEVLIQRPAKLEAFLNVESKENIIEGLLIKIIMQVTNIGEAKSINVQPELDISIVEQSDPSLSEIEFRSKIKVISAPSSQDIPGGESKDFVWRYFLDKGSAGTVKFKGDVEGKDENSKKEVTATGSLDITIGKQPELQVVDLKFQVKQDEIYVQVEKISEGQDFKVVMTVRNNGDVDVVDVIPKLLLEAGGREGNIQKVSGPLTDVEDTTEKYSISPKETKEYFWKYRTTEGAAGRTTLFTGSAKGKTEQAELSSNELTRNFLIQRRASLEATLSLLWEKQEVNQVSRGLIDITIIMDVMNNGEATAVDVRPELTLGKIGHYTLLSQPKPDKEAIPGEKSVTFTWTYKTDETTPTGILAFSGKAAGYDENSSEKVTAVAEPKEATIQNLPDLTFELKVPQGTFCLGQQAPVTITVKNEGEATAESVTPELELLGEDVLDPSLGPIPTVADIAGGTEQTYNWTYSTSKPGKLIFIGRIISGKDSNSHEDIFPTDELQATVDVVPAANLTLSFLTVSKDKVTKGQSITITLKVENTGTATALDVIPQLYIGDEEYTEAPNPERANIVGGESQEYTWEYDTTDSKLSEVTFRGTARGTSEHCDWAIESKELRQQKVLIQLPPSLIANIDVLPKQVSEGQEIKVTMSVTNEVGDYEADMVATAVEVKAPEELSITGTGKVSFVSFEEEPPPKEGKISILAGKTQGYIWTYTAETSGNATFSGNVSAKDENTGEDVSSNEAKSPQALIQTSPNIKAVLKVEKVTKEEEERVGIGQKFDVVVELTNSGQATAKITPATNDLTLSLPSLLGKTITLPIVAVSPTTLAIESGGREKITYSIKPLEIEVLKGKSEGEEDKIELKKLSIIDQNNPETAEKKEYLQPVEPANVHIDLERPKLISALYRDTNDQTDTLPTIDKGDQLILKFNEPTKIKAGIAAKHFVLFPEGSSLGETPTIPPETEGSTEITITLGGNPNLKVEGKTEISSRIAIKATDLIVDLAGNEFSEEGEVVTFKKAKETTFECDDRIPPQITNIRPNNDEGVNDQPIIRIWVTDEDIKGCETGIDRGSIQFTLRAEGGQEFDFGLNEVDIKREKVVVVELERGRIAHQFFEFALRASANPPMDKMPPLNEGKYELEVRLKDKSGNEASKKTSFRVVVDAIIDLVNYPNPFPVGHNTRIRYILSKPASSVTINIYDVAGRLVYATNADGSVGLHTDVTWDGKAASAEKLTAGIYICELVATMEGKEYRKYSKIAIRPPKKGEKY